MPMARRAERSGGNQVCWRVSSLASPSPRTLVISPGSNYASRISPVCLDTRGLPRSMLAQDARGSSSGHTRRQRQHDPQCRWEQEDGE